MHVLEAASLPAANTWLIWAVINLYLSAFFAVISRSPACGLPSLLVSCAFMACWLGGVPA